MFFHGEELRNVICLHLQMKMYLTMLNQITSRRSFKRMTGKIKPIDFTRNIYRTCLVIILISNHVHAQTNSFSFERYTINDGLSNNSINNVLQTSDGYLWIATKDGLNRYDGHTFKIFKSDIRDSLSLPENYVMTLKESRSKTLWIGTWGGGLCRYNQKKEKFDRLDHDDNRDDYIQSICEDHEGNIWFGTTLGGVYFLEANQLNLNADRIIPRRLENCPAENVTCIVEDKNHCLWFATIGEGLIKFDPDQQTFTQFKHNTQIPASLINNSIWSIYNDSNKFLYLSTNSGIDRFELETQKFVHHPDIHSDRQKFLRTTIRQIIRDSSGRLWCGTYDFQGLYLFENFPGGSKNLIHFLREDDNPQSLISNRIRCIYEDSKKNLWFGTEDGLNKLPKVHPFFQYRYMPLRESSLGGRVVSSIFEGRNNQLYIGFGDKGFDQIDLKTRKIIHHKPEPNNPNSISESEVVTIYEDSHEILWIGTSREGLNRFDPNTGKFKHYKQNHENPFSIKSNWVQQILETKSRLFLVGTNDALQIFDREKEKFYPFDPEVTGDSESFPQLIQVNSLFEDSEGNLWVGTWLDGLLCYNPKEKQLRRYMPDTQNPFSISASKVTTINEDSNGFIWVGTHSGGLNKFDKSTGRFYKYTTRSGLPNDVVFGILEDGSGCFWISTMKGLAKYDPVNEHIRVYDVTDGLIHNQFNWRASFKSKSGLMHFGGIDGFVSFYPDSIKIDYTQPPVVLTSFKVFDEEVLLDQPLGSTSEIVLDYNQNFFKFEFAALDIAPKHKHKFEYKLDGIDPHWVSSGSQSTASYTDIRSGEYKFLVKACNADGVWSEPISISMKILPPWWTTWWFRIMLIITIVMLALGIYRYRVKRILEIHRIRFNIAGDLHDEIGSNLSSISVESKMLLNSKALTADEREQLFDINKTAQETMEAMRDIIWFINPQNNAGGDTIFKMKETVARLLAGIDWSFISSPQVRFEAFNLEVNRNIFLIYKEALTNVVKHSKAAKCSITIESKPGQIEIKIKDYGKGFDLDNVKNTGGLRNMQQRAQKINAALTIKSEKGLGTEVNLKIPLIGKLRKGTKFFKFGKLSGLMNK